MHFKDGPRICFPAEHACKWYRLQDVPPARGSFCKIFHLGRQIAFLYQNACEGRARTQLVILTSTTIVFLCPILCTAGVCSRSSGTDGSACAIQRFFSWRGGPAPCGSNSRVAQFTAPRFCAEGEQALRTIFVTLLILRCLVSVVYGRRNKPVIVSSIQCMRSDPLQSTRHERTQE